MPEFTQDYFTPRIPDWTRLLIDQRGWDPDQKHVVVEIGAFEGRSSVWMHETLLRHPESRLYCIDSWRQRDGRAFELFQANIAELDGNDRITVMRMASHAALHNLRSQRVMADLVYVDGSHFGCDVLSDLVQSFFITRTGGVMICDDYLWRGRKERPRALVDTPKPAIDAFTTCYARKLRIIEDVPLYQLAFEKLAD